eukprot:gene14876-18021_t
MRRFSQTTRNGLLFAGLTAFTATVYFYSIWKMGNDDFKDINDFGFQKEKDPVDLSKLKRRPRGSGPKEEDR